MPAWVQSLLLTAAFFAGLAAIAVGVALVYFPAGLVTAGAILVVAVGAIARADMRAGP